ncbi:MAG: hypothetical protein M3Z04_16015, partial [Chloroflexota bacterium]|nr:hypothetical protein [Chloroflexota bacterium]
MRQGQTIPEQSLCVLALQRGGRAAGNPPGLWERPPGRDGAWHTSIYSSVTPTGAVRVGLR